MEQFLKLSPEQIFAAFAAERQARDRADLFKARAERAKAEAGRAKTEAEHAKAEAGERAEREKRRADRAETIINTIRHLHADAYRDCAARSRQVRTRYGNVDEIISREIVDLVKYTLEEWQHWILIARSYLRETPMVRQGPDIKKEKAEAREDEKSASGESAEERKKLTAASKGVAALQRCSNILSSMARGEQESSLSNAQSAVIDIYKTGLPEKEAASATLRGRQVKDRKADAQTTAFFGENRDRCHACGGETVPLDEGVMDRIVSIKGMPGTIAQSIKQYHELRLCKKCGHVSFAVSDDQDLPMCPGREPGLNMVITYTEGLCVGMPPSPYLLTAQKPVFHRQ